MTRERQGTVQVHVEQCRPCIKIASNTSYGGVAQCNFSSDFQSAQVSWLESIVEVVTQYDFTIEFPLIHVKPNLYYMN